MAAAPAAGGQGGGMDAALLDDIIRRLLEVRTARPGKQVQLSESEIDPPQFYEITSQILVRCYGSHNTCIATDFFFIA